MSYKTILVHVDGAPTAPERVAVATQIASQHDAHLVGAATTGLITKYCRGGDIMLAAALLQEEIDRTRQDATVALEDFERQARAAALRHESRLTDDEPQTGLVLQARYADLVVLSQSAPGQDGLLAGPGLPVHLALFGRRPVLVVPHAGSQRRLERHALVAWDGSGPATRAVTDALPLLRRSARVTVAVFDPGRQSIVHGAQPGADIALFLARHDVNAEVLERATPAGQGVGDALLSLAAELGADLLVMGAYGHLRWREMVLGGVTRTVLAAMTLPVLLSH